MTELYLVLADAKGQHSLWPSDVDLPMGWRIVHGPVPREQALDYVAEHWTRHMRGRSANLDYRAAKGN